MSLGGQPSPHAGGRYRGGTEQECVECCDGTESIPLGGRLWQAWKLECSGKKLGKCLLNFSALIQGRESHGAGHHVRGGLPGELRRAYRSPLGGHDLQPSRVILLSVWDTHGGVSILYPKRLLHLQWGKWDLFSFLQFLSEFGLQRIIKVRKTKQDSNRWLSGNLK